MKESKDDIMFRVMNDFVIHPRKLNRDVLDGVLTRDEYHVYVWLRGSANPYAVAVVTLRGINQDVFGGRHGDSYINKILLSLKSKKYLYYKKRQGCRGSFEVKIADFLLPTKRITTYEGISGTDSIRSDSSSQVDDTSEVTVDLFDSVQKLDDLKSMKKQLLSSVSIDTSFRSSNNDNYNYNNKDKNRSESRPILVETFIPKTDEEETCLNIAQQVGEKDMRFLLSKKDQYGIQLITDAYEELCNYKKNHKVDNLPALLTSIILQLIKFRFADNLVN
jgi:hypothetical protein